MAHTVTQLLQRWQAGDEEAMRALVPCTIEELRALASKTLRNASGSELQADELVNEAYIKLADLTKMSWDNRLQFFAFAARVMRNILMDHFRRDSAVKRGRGKDLTLFDLAREEPLGNEELGALAHAIEALYRLDQRKAAVVEMRFFAGMTSAEIAAYFGIAEKTAKRDWQFAKTWLYRKMTGDRPEAP